MASASAVAPALKFTWQNGVLRLSGLVRESEFSVGQNFELLQSVSQYSCSLGVYKFKSYLKGGGLAFVGDKPKKSRLSEYSQSHGLELNLQLKNAENIGFVQHCSSWIFASKVL